MNAPIQHPPLTGKLAEVAEVAGVAAALKLASALGGQELKLSSVKGGKLAGIVGQEAAEAIVEAFGRGEKFTVPMAHLRGARGRREAVAQMVAAGVPISKAAQAADVHERTARRAKNRPVQPLPMFPED